MSATPERGGSTHDVSTLTPACSCYHVVVALGIFNMTEYHKIQTVFKRDMDSPNKNLIIGDWTLPEFHCLENCRWQFTEKVDGTNIRVIWEDQTITFAGRTERATIPQPLRHSLEGLFCPLVEAFRKEFNDRTVVLYGEGYGGSIQAGQKYSIEPDFILFDIKIGRWWLQREDLVEIADKLGLTVVPTVGSGTLHDAITMVRAGLQSTFGDFEAEGIVARPITELMDRSGRRIITKIKSRDFQ